MSLGVFNELARLAKAPWRSLLRRSDSVLTRRSTVRHLAAVPTLAPHGAVDFLFAADTGQNTRVRAGVLSAMHAVRLRTRTHFLVLGGDTFYPSGVESVHDQGWETHFRSAFAHLALPVYACLGNHDHGGNVAAQVEYSKLDSRWHMPSTYYSFRHALGSEGLVEFFVLDTQSLRVGWDSWFHREQIKWLERALACSHASWKVVVGHHPLASGGPKRLSTTLRRILLPLFARHDVGLYLSGHNHSLELLDPERGWLQVVSGAGSQSSHVPSTQHTLFRYGHGGFVRIVLGSAAAWVEFIGSDGATLSVFEWTRSAVGSQPLVEAHAAS